MLTEKEWMIIHLRDANRKYHPLVKRSEEIRAKADAAYMRLMATEKRAHALGMDEEAQDIYEQVSNEVFGVE